MPVLLRLHANPRIGSLRRARTKGSRVPNRRTACCLGQYMARACKHTGNTLTGFDYRLAVTIASPYCAAHSSSRIGPSTTA
jgi:hypothetical protein